MNLLLETADKGKVEQMITTPTTMVDVVRLDLMPREQVRQLIDRKTVSSVCACEAVFSV